MAASDGPAEDPGTRDFESQVALRATPPIDNASVVLYRLWPGWMTLHVRWEHHPGRLCYAMIGDVHAVITTVRAVFISAEEEQVCHRPTA